MFLYPGTVDKPLGKLRLLYESAPLAMLAEQAGGYASTGMERLLSYVPQELHQRTPLVIGSSEDVKLVESFIQDGARRDSESKALI